MIQPITSRIGRSVIIMTLLSGIVPGLYATDNSLLFEINTAQKKTAIPATLYGLFFEDINFGADGGLYAELIKNRSFEFPQSFMGWKVFGNVTLQNDGPFDKNPHYVRLSPSGHRSKFTGIENEGFFGIGLKQQEEYRFSVWARCAEGNDVQKIKIELGDNGSANWSQAFNSMELDIDSKEWKKYEVVFKAAQTNPKSYLRIFQESPGTVDLEHVSLFPTATWQGHKNGLRKDLAQALADLKPGVFRFPGGCVVEGAELSTRYEWKKTVGPVENRPLNENRWHYTFKNRLYPDYNQTNGLGFYEYFLLSEEMGAEPIPILNCGLICQYMATSLSEHAPLDSLDCFIQDALDLIEFANGPATSEWGKVRAEMGHPEPFGLKYIGIGNEQWGKEYVERLEPFISAIRKKHPQIKIIGGAGPQAEGKEFEYLWPEMKRLQADLVDEHFYRNEEWFLAQGARYDAYDRKGPKVFAGEYACHGKDFGQNHFNAALMEAAFLTGIERNCDIVEMATYAPLFAHVEGWQWRPDMIWFDNLNHVKTSNYHVQQLYATYKGTHLLPLTCNDQPVNGRDNENGMFASAVWDDDTQSYIVKIVNTTDERKPVKLQFNNLKKKSLSEKAHKITLRSTDLKAENTIEEPYRIIPEKSQFKVTGDLVEVESQPREFTVYQFFLNK